MAECYAGPATPPAVPRVLVVAVRHMTVQLQPVGMAASLFVPQRLADVGGRTGGGVGTRCEVGDLDLHPIDATRERERRLVVITDREAPVDTDVQSGAADLPPEGQVVRQLERSHPRLVDAEVDGATPLAAIPGPLVAEADEPPAGSDGHG